MSIVVNYRLKGRKRNHSASGVTILPLLRFSLSIIYLPRILCLSYSCLSSSHIPVIVAERWVILYVLEIKLTKDTRRRVLRGRDYRWRDRKETDRRGRVWIYFSLFKPNFRNMNVDRATCSCSVELYKQWFTLADFCQTGIFRGVFSVYYLPEGSAKLRWAGQGSGYKQ